MSTSSCAAARPTGSTGHGDSEGQCLRSYHQHLINISEGKEPDIVFLGDHTTAFLSITQVWDILFAQSHSLNLSAVEDKTHDLLWRLENSLLDKVTPKVVVISIGSNNLRTGDSPQTIAAGIEACVRAVRTHKKGEKQPFIIVMGLLPCCQQESPLRALVSETNQLLHAATENLDDCQLIDVSSIFVKGQRLARGICAFYSKNCTSKGLHECSLLCSKMDLASSFLINHPRLTRIALKDPLICQEYGLRTIHCGQEDGSISHTDMFDFFHLTKYGYYKAFEPVHDLASQILQEAYGIKFTKSTDRLCDMDGAV
ncbi:platelet-activating factor acetylhydrolase IB subunit beta-like isoform X1 [Varroa jacobsoni]|uniref:SGNH hydrolase-type esterase domain-containing protein n=1 Tax=Varroa destructor TaxID=109461 RepID=A0A7M7JEC3_VARDE|nr:platelet-activating factor acetylhydrolase IB subunit beta-like isoform X1 [Varroa destructor]XP_022701708.1 platelet-activating factor acetylhydrolase IB subunit beta-like isoform X1 [Varroa jacobsoni]XP_022701709.1 platelet-activating factor acetylhydrolase IB subunit beta-like isoform X1 [Varroa jacobsoni]